MIEVMPRSVWSGNIAFGLVSIPVELHSAIEDQSIHFHLVTKDGSCRLRQKLFCPDTGKEYDFKQSARAFEVAPGELVVVDKDELKALRPESGHIIEISQFVALSEIDPIFFNRSYFIAPGKRAEKAYVLLREAINQSGKVALGKVVMRERQYSVLVRGYRNGLLMNTLNYAAEVRAIEELNIPAETEAVGKRELQLAADLIAAMTGPFEPDEIKDTYKEEIEALLKKKAAGAKIKVAPAKRDAPVKVVNLMDRLKESLAQSKAGKSARKGSDNGGRRRAANS